MRKDKGFHVRVERDLRESFVQACWSQNETAGQVMRQFMRQYVERYRSGMQGELFQQRQEQRR